MKLILTALGLLSAIYAETFTVTHDCSEIAVYQLQCSNSTSVSTKSLSNQRVSVEDSNGTVHYISTDIKVLYDNGTETTTTSDSNGSFSVDIKAGISFKIATYNPYSLKFETHQSKFRLFKYKDNTLVFRYYYEPTRRWRNLDTSNNTIINMK